MIRAFRRDREGNGSGSTAFLFRYYQSSDKSEDFNQVYTAIPIFSVCMSVCVCMFVYAYVCECVYVFVGMCVCVCLFECVCVRMCV